MNNTENGVTEERKSATTKWLAIVGFLALIILMVWLAVKIVGVIPNAFTSLASIADSVYNYNKTETLDVSTEQSVVNANESFSLNWNQTGTEGEYRFSYECTEGISLEVRGSTGGIMALGCDTEFTVTDASSLDLRIASERNRFTDINYTLSFVPENENRETITETGQVTVVNASIPTRTEGEDDDDTEDQTEDDQVAVDPNEDDEPAQPSTTPRTPTQVEQVVSVIPVSDPNGYVDLQITFKSVGTQSGSRYTPDAEIETDETGAFQFEVKNLGTKTSGEWSFEAELPSGITYESDDLEPLRPNERSLFTLGFTGISKTGLESFGVELDAENDVNSKNDSFTWVVNIVD